jgi:hypothetical protein
MTHLEEAQARFEKLIHAPGFQDFAWANEIQDQLAAQRLTASGRPVCPVLRPHFISRRQQDNATKVTQVLYGALQKLQQMAAVDPSLLSRLESIPAEKMLAQVEPGYTGLTAASFATMQMQNSHLSLTAHSNEGPTGVLITDALAELFWESKPMKELRKKYKFAKPAKSSKLLVQSIFTAYKGTPAKGRRATMNGNGHSNGLKKFPRIAIVEASQGARFSASVDSQLLAETLRQMGYPTEVVSPEQLEYRNGVLCRGDFGIEIVYRRISAQELLVRFDLNHPLLRAYREGTVRMINSFRSDMLAKPAVLTLLSDETILAHFPAAERKILAAHVPWSRMVSPGKVTVGKATVDLIEHILQNREKLVLRPNDVLSDAQTYRGWETEPLMWERALRVALRTPYVVQERTPEARATFPVMQLGRVDMREMRIETHCHIFGGKVEGSSATVSDATSAFSMLNGLAPVFVLEGA